MNIALFLKQLHESIEVFPNKYLKNKIFSIFHVLLHEEVSVIRNTVFTVFCNQILTYYAWYLYVVQTFNYELYNWVVRYNLTADALCRMEDK